MIHQRDVISKKKKNRFKSLLMLFSTNELKKKKKKLFENSPESLLKAPPTFRRIFKDLVRCIHFSFYPFGYRYRIR